MAGKYTEFEKQADGNLRIVLLPEARDEVEEIASQELDADSKLAEAIEWQLANGWSFLRPEDVGALTDAPILSEEVDTDEQGEVRSVGIVYWYPQYQVHDPVAQLLQEGYVEFAVSSDGRKATAADPDIPPEDRKYAVSLLQLARQERGDLPEGDQQSVAYVVLSALIEMLEDAANGYVTLTGLPVAIREGLENEELITPPQKRLVGLNEEQEQQRRALYRRYLQLIERRTLTE